MKYLILFLPFLSMAQQTDHWRPKYHFSPAKNWMNDPNGLIYVNGDYHLFFQHNPLENKWGHMSWGHAVSQDLVRWKELPLAIPEGEEEWIFSGSVVEDKTNSSGFFSETGSGLVAIYTADYHGTIENQHIAYSKDAGLTWTKYAGNPVLSGPIINGELKTDFKDFRDPNVFWNLDHWIMAVALPKEHKVQFYASKNLIDWVWLSDFGPEGNANMLWECPALVQIPIKNLEGRVIGQKDILLLSSEGPYPGFVGMQYFVGDFDGKKFTSEYVKYLDYGKDFYAAIPFSQAPKTTILGWVASWQYTDQLPTQPWKGQMSLAREIYLDEKTGNLVQEPIVSTQNWETVTEVKDLPLPGLKDMSFVMEEPHYHVSAELLLGKDQNFSIEIIDNGNGKVSLEYNALTKELVLDRSGTEMQLSPTFSEIQHLYLPLKQNKIELDLFVDGCILEVFVNQGQHSLSSLIFPEAGKQMVRIFGESGTAKKIQMKKWLGL